MKILIALIISTFALAVSAEETAICIGDSWAYKFILSADKCIHEQRATKDIPGIYKKGHVNKFLGKDALAPVDCWKSLARIQMDGARCCLNSIDNPNSCSSKKLSY